MPTRQTLESQEKFNQLKALLREMFQLDRGDLDFGLYRIINMMADKITKFLDDDLLPQVKTILARVSDEDRADLEKHIEDAEAMAKALGFNPDNAPKVIELKRQLAEARTDAEAEADVYGHLANFFSRYYSEGDFMSLRRYSGGGDSAYHIPYDGEEVKLHWANADQYYIKTAENYSSYAFTPQKNRHVRFETVAADNKKDNIKETNGRQCRFVLVPGKDAIVCADDTLIVRFEHRPLTDNEKKKFPGNGNGQQNRINHTTTERVLQNLNPDWQACLSEPEPTTANGERTKLEKHVECYTAKNSFDYFIHKGLGGFLRREMDFYLKSEVFNLNDFNVSNMIQLRRAQSQMRATREMGEKIISFLEQLENFQKKLWLKKKFVLETNWCVTLDRVPETFYAEITANKRQIEEWKELFAISEIDGSSANGDTRYSDPPTIGFLKANPYLTLDTRHFDHEFASRLLSALSETGSLDDQADGLLIHGENFQAVNLLQERYLGQVKAVHIDPPYNTQTSGFLYKNGYQHSSWLAMMRDRIASAYPLLDEDGAFLCHIDENEYEKLHALFADLEIPDSGTIIWDKKNPMRGRKGIATQHEYILWRTRSESKIYAHPENLHAILAKAADLIKMHDGVNEHSRKEFDKWIRSRNNLTGGEQAYKYIDDDGQVFQSVGMGAPDRRADSKFHIPLIHPSTGKPCPVPSNGWSRTPETLQQLVQNNEIVFGKDETVQPRLKVFLTDKSRRQIPSVISDSGRGKNDIDKLGLEFPYCHPVSLYKEILAAAADKDHDLILDYFAGSGTTAHAIINLNRVDRLKRKYVLVEIGEHFETVLLPRIKKVIYSIDWKDGKPTSRDKGVSQLFKYIHLESYEDTLDGLVWEPRESDLFAENPALSEDYQLHYSLDAETKNSTNLLGMDCPNPFAYTISTVRDGVLQDTPIDLPETFNYLIGLRVHAYQKIDDVLSITGTDSQKRNCLILWRNLEKTDNTKLEKWFSLNRRHLPDSLDLVYVNGDHTLNAIRGKKDIWTAETIEPVFRALMFEDCPHGK